jgi:hypothetical protein
VNFQRNVCFLLLDDKRVQRCVNSFREALVTCLCEDGENGDA